MSNEKVKNMVFFSDMDPYLDDVYHSINDSRMQRKIRALKPFPVTVVYYQQQNHTMKDIKKQLKDIKELGFTGLKQICLKEDDGVLLEEVEFAALDTGLVPWHYGEAGWETVNNELLERLGISVELSMEEIQKHPVMLKYQEEYYRNRIKREKERPQNSFIKMGEPGRAGLPIPERLIPAFSKWLEEQYKSIDVLKRAWNCDVFKKAPIRTFEEAARFAGLDVRLAGNNLGFSDMRRYRDAMRFQADLQAFDIEGVVRQRQEFDPEEPQRTGGHQLFENQALNGWDLETQAQAIREGGSFYSSVHLVHHFDEVDGEIDRPVYIQSRMINDFFKGGWSAVWESTGGPAVYSGHKAAGVDEGVITRLMLSYVAAGLKGIGFWCWDARDTGWEIGEYALTDLTGEPASRAIVAGRIAQAIQKHRFELWEGHNRPMVGVLYSWDNEAAFARLSFGGYPVKRQTEIPWYPSYARIGACRALINNNIPFEFVTQKDLESGLAGRYRIIYLPHTLCLPQNTMELLAEYVEKGGRLVADMPCAMMDEHGRLYDTRPGSAFEKVFGFTIADYQHTNTIPMLFDGAKIQGQFADIKGITAQITGTFHNGKPAVLENSRGRGTTAFMAFEASAMCFKPGNTSMEKKVAETVMGVHETEWNCDIPMVHRLWGPKADHFFFINDGEEKWATLDTRKEKYTTGCDAVSGENISIMGKTLQVRIPAYSGKWIRLQKV